MHLQNIFICSSNNHIYCTVHHDLPALSETRQFSGSFYYSLITSVYVQLSLTFSLLQIWNHFEKYDTFYFQHMVCACLCDDDSVLSFRPMSGQSDEKNQTRQQDAPSGSLLSRSSRRRQRYSCKCLTCVFLTRVWHPPSVDWKSKTAAPLPDRSQRSLVEMWKWSTPSPVWSGQRADSSSSRTLTPWRSTRSEFSAFFPTACGLWLSR